MSEAEEPPHWTGHPKHLRGKLLKRGAGAPDDHEVLEVLLMAVTPRRDVKPFAKALQARFKSLSAILAAPADDRVKVDGAGETVAAQIKAIAELNSRAAREEIGKREVISSRTALTGYVRREIQHEAREQSCVLFLDPKNQLIIDEIMGLGTVEHASVYLREIARRALEVQCTSLILVHNQPSGDPKPCRADIDITREIIDVLQPFDISVHDHLIVGTSGVVSFRSSGLI